MNNEIQVQVVKEDPEKVYDYLRSAKRPPVVYTTYDDMGSRYVTVIVIQHRPDASISSAFHQIRGYILGSTSRLGFLRSSRPVTRYVLSRSVRSELDVSGDEL